VTPSKIYNTTQEIVEAAYGYLQSHFNEGERWGKPFHFYKPANSKYGAHQWLWDSGFHMMIWSHRTPENSIKDLRTMLQFQQPNGFIPEMIYWGDKSFLERMADKFFGYSRTDYTDISQMPMLGYSLRAIWDATQNVELLKEFVPKLAHYLEWWDKERDPDKDGLISIIHPWESGLDASPLYDQAHGVKNPEYKQLYPKFLKLLRTYKKKYQWNVAKILEAGIFNVEDVGLCAIYADNWSVLSKLADNFDQNLADKCMKYSKKYQQKIIEKCWSDDHNQFVSYYHHGKEEKITNIETIQSLFPLVLDDLPKDLQQKLVSKLKDPKKFGTKYPVPTTAVSESEFDPEDSRLMWRGPTWPNTNSFIMEGLVKHGYTQEANDLLDKWTEMHQLNGIYEYHNPITGAAEGQEGLGMANMIVDWLHRMKRM
jgi:mannosylglycerate hydrolase